LHSESGEISDDDASFISEETGCSIEFFISAGVVMESQIADWTDTYPLPANRARLQKHRRSVSETFQKQYRNDSETPKTRQEEKRVEENPPPSQETHTRPPAVDSPPAGDESESSSRKAPQKEHQIKLSDVDAIIEIWNKVVVNHLPLVEFISEKRTAKVRARLAVDPDPEFWRGVFLRVRASPFLCGHGDGSKWKASFDWIMNNDTNYIKVLEGNYDAKTQKHGSGETLRDIEHREFLQRLG